MKKFISLCLVFVLTIISVGVVSCEAVAADNYTETIIEELDNGYYVETVIEYITTPMSVQQSIQSTQATSTVTATKTSYYKNSNDEVMWSVSATGTFTYNGSSSTCTSCSHSATAYGSTWSIKRAGSFRSGNTATAYATATHTFLGISADYTISVDISCSANGTIS